MVAETDSVELEKLLIEPRHSIVRSSVGDFCVEVSGNKLHVPQDVVILLQQVGISFADEFVGYTYESADALGRAMNWSPEQVKQARTKLIAVLYGYVPNEILFPGTASADKVTKPPKLAYKKRI